MKQIPIIILLFFSTSSFAQMEVRDSAKPRFIWKGETQNTAIEDTNIVTANMQKNFIPEIRSVVKRINAYSAYKTKVLENDEFIDGTDNGSSLTGYFKNGVLTKINVWVGLSHCIVTREYFLDHGNLIFAYEQLRAFPYIQKPDTDYFDYEHPHVAMESRFYFRNGKLIQKITKGEPECTSMPISTELLSDCKEYSVLLQK